MKNIEEIISNIGLIPVIVIDDAKKAKDVAVALEEGGIPLCEITFRTKDAKEAIKIIHKECPNVLIGAGTVVSKEQVADAVEAGASFIVTPGFDKEIVEYCLQNNYKIFPGVSTPSEISIAQKMGLNILKFFPCEELGGIKMLKAMSAPFTKMKFIPTGGIDLSNLESYLNCDKVLACGGSFIAKKDDINNNNFEKIKNNAIKTVEKIKNIRNGSTEENKIANADITTNITNKKVVAFGEIMLRLAPQGYERFLQSTNFEATFGGAEANVSVSLANYGLNSYFVSKVPMHEIGQACINSLRKFGVNIDYVLRDGDRLGIYYCEKGASQRPSKVIYDRKNSAIAFSKKDEFDWNKIFENASWFHFTGITPALGDNVFESCLEACKKAKEKGIIVSCDLNYRKKLWSKEKAKEKMTELSKYIDICIGNETDFRDVFGIEIKNANIENGKINEKAYIEAINEIVKKYKFKKVAVSIRQSINANENGWSGIYYDGKDFYFSKKYMIHIVDRVGSGDAFTAGLIDSIICNKTSQEVIDFAVAASCLKHSIEGDFNMVTRSEVEDLINGDTTGRIQR